MLPAQHLAGTQQSLDHEQRFTFRLLSGHDRWPGPTRCVQSDDCSDRDRPGSRALDFGACLSPDQVAGSRLPGLSGREDMAYSGVSTDSGAGVRSDPGFFVRAGATGVLPGYG